MNILSYFIFLIISAYITFYVGWACYKNGYQYVLELFDHDEHIATAINKLLLVAYYLVNLGFVLYAINCWSEINTMIEMINEIASKISTVILCLCILHFKNMSVIYIMRRYRDHRFIKFITP